MEYMKDWLKTILYMNVFLLVVEGIVQKTKYEPYLRFFSGVLFVLCLMKPVVDLSGKAEVMDASFLKNQWENEWKMLSRSGELKETGDELRKEYEKSVKSQIERMAEECVFHDVEVMLSWDEKKECIDKITVYARPGQQADADAFCEALEQYYGLGTGRAVLIQKR